MNTKFAMAAAFSLAVLSSGSSFAADRSNALTEGFSAQLEQAQAASQNGNTAALGREERQIAGNYLTMAESLWAQGATAKAQSFLSFARGTLGLAVPAPDDDGQRVTMMFESRI